MARFHFFARFAGLALCIAAAVAVGTPAWADSAEGGCAPAAAPPADPCPPCECYEAGCREKAEKKCPAKYDNLRFREDWRACFCSPCDREDWSDWIKQLAPGGQAFFRMDFGGQVRFRYEGFKNLGFSKTTGVTDGWFLTRLRAHGDFQFGEIFRVFAEGIYADVEGRRTPFRPIDVNEGDFLNLFAEARGCIGGWNLGAAAGRREIQFGAQRLISPLDWANTRRTFQGAYGWVARDHQRLDGFYTRPVIIDPYDWDEWNEDVDFYGLYYTNKRLTHFVWDVYVLGLHRDAGTYFDVAGEEDRFTIGGRVNHKVPGTRFDYDCETGIQLGTFGDDDILAGFFSLDAGFKPCGWAWNPRFALGFDYASGNRDGGSQNTFNQLFPLGHAYFGCIDLIGRQNLIAGRFTTTFKPSKTITLKAELHGFWRDSLDDAVYNVGGGILRAPGDSRSRFTGAELDFTFKWKPGRHWTIEGGVAHFFTGSFLADTGPDDDVSFIYLSTQYTF